jgi:transposase
MEDATDTKTIVSGQMKDGRRKYDKRAKRALIERCLKGEESIARIAQAHDINPNLLHKWITRYRSQAAAHRQAQTVAQAESRLLPPFIPVVATPPAADPQPSAPAPVEPSNVKATLPNGIVLEIDQAAGARLEALIHALWTLPCSASPRD